MYPNTVINILIHITDKYKELNMVYYVVQCTTYEGFSATKLL